MARKRWITLPGGRIKRWKKSKSESKCEYGDGTPPHSYRNHLNRLERRKSFRAIQRGETEAFLFIHKRIAGWYW